MSPPAETHTLPRRQEPLRALLVGTYDREGQPLETVRELLSELSLLCDTLGLQVLDALPVRIREPQSRYLVGSGKAEELASRARENGADVVVFDDTLSPSQQRNWEQLTGRSVIDRQEVILDIFARHARSREAVLQVALARAEYDLPRLKRRWVHLSRERGMRGGLMGRGKGEQQIEMDYRQVRHRITQLREELAAVLRGRHVQRRRRERHSVPVAAIVGYTNAGKSALFNALTDAGVVVQDKLFATLDPTVRRLRLPNHQELLLADTVGFIRKLPHLLVEAFKSTLEEVAVADFLVEVLDASSPDVEAHHDTTCEVLNEIGAGRLPVVTVFNKIDLVADPLRLQRLRRRQGDALFVSARTGAGRDRLLERLTHQLEHTRRQVDLFLPHDRYDVLALVHRCGQVLHQEFSDDGIVLSAAVPVSALAPLAPFRKKTGDPIAFPESTG